MQMPRATFNNFCVPLCVLTISVEYGLTGNSCPKLVGRVAHVLALVLLNGVHCITECVESGRARVLRNLQLWVAARVKRLPILRPVEACAKNTNNQYHLRQMIHKNMKVANFYTFESTQDVYA